MRLARRPGASGDSTAVVRLAATTQHIDTVAMLRQAETKETITGPQLASVSAVRVSA